MEELITIATFENAHQAYLLKARLEAEGITCSLQDVYMNSLIPTGSFGGIKLQVRLSQSIQALNIYYEYGEGLGTTKI